MWDMKFWLVCLTIKTLRILVLYYLPPLPYGYLPVNIGTLRKLSRFKLYVAFIFYPAVSWSIWKQYSVVHTSVHTTKVILEEMDSACEMTGV